MAWESSRPSGSQTALGSAPQHVVLVGIVGADFGAGVGLSPSVASAVDRAAGLVEEVVRSMPAVSHGWAR